MMILLPWYLYALSCMASFVIAWILLSLLTSGKIDDLNSAIATTRKEAAEWKTLAELYHEGLHKQADKVHAEKLAEIEASSQKDDYVDWSKVPEGYDWVAVDDNDGDKNKLAYFEKEPHIFENDNYWTPIEYGFAWNYGYTDSIIGPLPPWRESLRKRPGK